MGVKASTPTLKMALLSFPTEILEEVVMLVIQDVGLDEAMKLRLICRKANHLDLRFQLNYKQSISMRLLSNAFFVYLELF